MRNRYGAAVFSFSEIGLLRRFAPVVVNELELRQIAESDHLTGALTRRTWTIRAIAEIAGRSVTAARSRGPRSISTTSN